MKEIKRQKRIKYLLYKKSIYLRIKEEVERLLQTGLNSIRIREMLKIKRLQVISEIKDINWMLGGIV